MNIDFLEVLLDAALDTIKTLPFLLAAYLLIEWLEHRASDKLVDKLRSAEKYGPLAGALAGCVPQCGFAVLAGKLYNAGAITLGALFAVFVSTSDDALIVLLSNGAARGAAAILLTKLVIAVGAGFLCDAVLRQRGAGGVLAPRPHEEEEEHDHGGDNCHCECGGSIWRPALRRTAQTLSFIFAVLLTLGLLTALIGEQELSALLLAGTPWQPLASALFGIIPGCAPSVIIAQLYAGGSLSFGGALAGLISATGVGLAVFFKARGAKAGIKLALALAALGAICGVVADLII